MSNIFAVVSRPVGANKLVEVRIRGLSKDQAIRQAAAIADEGEVLLCVRMTELSNIHVQDKRAFAHLRILN